MTDPRSPDTLDALLTHTEWVRALAQRLVHPEHDADDVVQETWVTVLERPPRPGGNVRAWLSTVVRNVVRQSRRADTRRRRREEAGARAEAEADTASVVERAEVHRRLVNTVMKMREPYRTAVLLRFFEGLAPREIAAKLGVPPETARSRVQRGVAVLRAQLDDAWGDRAAWVAVLAPLIQAPAVLSASAGGGGAAAVGGGALLSAPAKVALGGVVLAAAVGGAVIAPSLLDPGQGDAPPEPMRRAAVVAEFTDPAPRRAAIDNGTKHPAKRKPAPPSNPPGEPPPKAPPSASATPGGTPTGRDPTESSEWLKLRNSMRSPPKPKPAAAVAPVATHLENEVKRSLEKEVGRMARLFADLEKAEARGALDTWADVWKKITRRVETSRRKSRDLLTVPGFWTAVFTHPTYRRYPGRSGKKRNQKLEFESLGRRREVRWHADVPPAYRAKKPMALVLGLSDTRGSFRAKQLLRRFWALSGPAEVIVVAPEFPRTHVKTASASWSDRSMLWASLGVVGRMTRDYNIAFDRLFLDGGGEGAADVWRIASNFADTYAGFIVRGAAPPVGTRLEDFRHNAFLLVAVEGSSLDRKRAMTLRKRMRALGIDVSVADQDTKTGTGRGISETNGFDPAPVFVKKRRPHYPLELDWSVKAGHTRRHFWVASLREIEDEAIAVAAERKKRPSFQVKVDRKKNKLLITTHRIVGLEIRLNDAILDLGRRVVVEVNGKKLLRKRVKRSLRDLYRGHVDGGDPTRIYPASLTIKIPDAR